MDDVIIDNLINREWIIPRLLEVFNENKMEDDNFIIEKFKDGIDIKNNGNPCCKLSFKKEEDLYIINIDFLIKCSPVKSGTRTITNIILFGRKYNYDCIELKDISEIDFKLGKKDVIISLTQLKLLSKGTSWYGTMGFKNEKTEIIEPIIQSVIIKSFQEFIEDFNNYIDKFEIDEGIKTKKKEDFVNNIQEYITKISEFCNESFDMNTIIRECFSNLEKCIYKTFEKYNNPDNPPDNPENIKVSYDNMSLIDDFIQFILSIICKTHTGIIETEYYKLEDKKMEGEDSLLRSNILFSLRSNYDKLRLNLKETSTSPISELVGGRKKGKKIKQKIKRKTKKKNKNKKRFTYKIKI